MAATNMAKREEDTTMADVRKNANTMPAAEFENFIRACVILKSTIVGNAGGQPFSVYDQWVAVHGCIMGVRTPGSAVFRNLGHQNIGFLPWHREYLRRFELALQSVVPGVTIPYWEWPSGVPEPIPLFTNARAHPIFFTSSVLNAVGGLFALNGPAAPPAWWPPGFRWRIHPALQVGGSNILRRGSAANTWPPTAAIITSIENSNVGAGGNPYWTFWNRLESDPRTHNTGHNIVGGYMANPVFSPNDPLFWLHHSYVDRVWARWQLNRLAAQPGSSRTTHYPAPAQVNPFNGQVPPDGHRLNDIMWPWVGGLAGYSVNAAAAVQAMLPSFAGIQRRVRNTLDNTNMGGGLAGYSYT